MKKYLLLRVNSSYDIAQIIDGVPNALTLFSHGTVQQALENYQYNKHSEWDMEMIKRYIKDAEIILEFDSFETLELEHPEFFL